MEDHCEGLPQREGLGGGREHLDLGALGLPHDEEHWPVLDSDAIGALQVKVVLGLEGARLEEGDRHKVALEAVVVARDVLVVLLLLQLLLVKLDLDLHVLLAVAHVVALDVTKVYQVVELVVGVELSDELLRVACHHARGIQSTALSGVLLVPADGGLGEVDAADPCLEGEVGLEGRVGQHEGRAQAEVALAVQGVVRF